MRRPKGKRNNYTTAQHAATSENKNTARTNTEKESNNVEKIGKRTTRKPAVRKTELRENTPQGKGIMKTQRTLLPPKHKNRATLQSQRTTKVDRRKQLQEAIPKAKQWKYKKNVRYGPEQQKWKCQKCAKIYGPQSMGNAILHASAHNNARTITRRNQRKAWGKDQAVLRDCRIRTLENKICTK